MINKRDAKLGGVQLLRRKTCVLHTPAIEQCNLCTLYSTVAHSCTVDFPHLLRKDLGPYRNDEQMLVLRQYAEASLLILDAQELEAETDTALAFQTRPHGGT